MAETKQKAPRLYPLRCCDRTLCWTTKEAITRCPHCGKWRQVQEEKGDGKSGKT